MNDLEKKQYLKNQLQDYLETRHNLDTRKNFNCLNPNHDDENPSMGYKNNIVKCFSCGESYDIFEIIGIDYNLDNFIDQFNKACELYGLNGMLDNRAKENGKHLINKKKVENDTFDYEKYFKEMQENIDACTYLEDRGISKEIIERYGIGYDPNFNISTGGQIWQAIIIPTSKRSFVARNINVNTKSKNKVRAKGARTPFNLEVLKQSQRPIYLVEGEIDALSILEVGGLAIGLGGDNNQNTLIQEIKKSETKAPLIVAFDNDNPGQKAGENLLEKLKKEKLQAYKINAFEAYNDPNDYLIANKEEFRQSIESNEQVIIDLCKAELERVRKEYIETNSTASYIQDFLDGIANQANTPYIPTGFKNLDNLLDGGIYSGLYILGAISSLGKTTLIMQIADQVAQQGQDVLIFSLEMARYELISKSISRHTIQIANENFIDSKNAKTSRGITTASRYEKYSRVEKDLIKEATKAYSEYANHLFISEGIGDIGAKEIKEAVERHIKLTGNTPLVIIDYLQILSPADIRATDKQNTDKAVLELKRLSRDYNTPVFAISSLNRDSYSKEVNMSAFKESGAIEYGSDVLIGLQIANLGQSRSEAKTNEAKSKEKREIELKILKNRSGKTGESVEFDYYTLFNYFKEKDR